MSVGTIKGTASTRISLKGELSRSWPAMPYRDPICTNNKSEGRARRILVVDDDETMRDLAETALLLAGFEVSKACDGDKAIEAFCQEMFDLVLTDQDMTGMDGWALADHIKDRSPQTAVGIMTGCDEEESRARMKKHRADFLIFKPFHISDLYSTIKSTLEARPW